MLGRSEWWIGWVQESSVSGARDSPQQQCTASTAVHPSIPHHHHHTRRVTAPRARSDAGATRPPAPDTPPPPPDQLSPPTVQTAPPRAQPAAAPWRRRSRRGCGGGAIRGGGRCLAAGVFWGWGWWLGRGLVERGCCEGLRSSLPVVPLKQQRQQRQQQHHHHHQQHHHHHHRSPPPPHPCPPCLSKHPA